MQKKISDRLLEEIHVRDLLPHRPPMILIDDLLRVTDVSLTAAAKVSAEGHFSVSNAPSIVSAPAYALECMAQAIAAWNGYRCLRAGRPVRIGLILGVRDFKSSTSCIRAGTELKIDADRLVETSDGIGVFDCTVESPNSRQSARLTVLSVDRLADIELRTHAGSSRLPDMSAETR